MLIQGGIVVAQAIKRPVVKTLRSIDFARWGDEIGERYRN